MLIGAGATLAGAAVALGAIELGMRAVGYGSVLTVVYGRAHYNPDLPELGYAGRPFARGIESNEGGADVAFNSHGFHDIEHARAKPPGAFRLMVVGNSFTAAIQVARRDGFVSQLGEALGQCPALAGRPVEAVNLGVGGYTIHQEYLLLRDYGLTLKPDFVVLQTNSFVVPGDLDPKLNLSPRLRRDADGKVSVDYSYEDTPQYRAKSSDFAVWLQNFSDRSRLVQYAIQYRQIMRDIAAEGAPEGAPEDEAALYRSFQQGRDLAFGEMAELLREKNIPFAVTIVPDADAESARPLGPEPVRDQWRQLAQKAGAPFIDVEDEARAQVRATGAYLHYLGANGASGHLDRVGNAFFGKALAARLCPLLGGESSASLAPKFAAQ
ncbi:SGNH/GDSL hydrolase family protein [Rhodoblastus sp.]|uniref:SGNH/GDSL hydrolase family protein n=1 Tax=Rhodoblastus sp. TaxID=1962975 RepID=UPI003F9B6F4A